MGPIKFKLYKGLPKNRRFNHTPIYYDGKKDVDESQYPTKFDAYGDVYNENDVSGQWYESRMKNRNRNNSGFNKTILVITVVLLLVFLFIIDFDLSIFFSQ